MSLDPSQKDTMNPQKNWKQADPEASNMQYVIVKQFK